MDWEVVLRLVNATGCVIALVILGLDAMRQRKSWNIKTQDHWLALSMWVLLGLAGAIEALSRGITVGPSSVLKLLAVAVTLRALLRKGVVVAERNQSPWKKEE